MTDKRIIEKMRKLLAMSQDISSENEAEIAMRQLHSMLSKYNLSMIDIKQSDEEQIDEVDFTYYNRPWVSHIVRGVSQLYFCQYYVMGVYDSRGRKKKKQYFIVGTDVNREFASGLIQNILSGIYRTSVVECMKTYGKRNTPFINSFRNSAGTRILSRCLDMIADAKEGLATDENGNTLPVLASVYDKYEKMIEGYYDEKGFIFSSTRGRGSQSNNALGSSLGYKHGSSVSLNRGLSRNSPKMIGN